MSDKLATLYPTEDDDDDDDELRQELQDALNDITNCDEEEEYNTVTANNKPMETINPFANPQPTQQPVMNGVPRTSWTPPISTPQGPQTPYYNRPTFGMGTTNYGTTVAAGRSAAPVSKYSAAWGNRTNGVNLDRGKKIILCEFMGVIAETYSGETAPRGAYDLHINSDVCDKLACFSPDYIFILSNQRFNGQEDAERWKTIVDYYSLCVTDRCNLRENCCQAFISPIDSADNPYMMPNTGLIEEAMMSIAEDWNLRYCPQDLILIGSMSGNRGQSDRNLRLAQNFGIDYLSIEDFISAC